MARYRRHGYDETKFKPGQREAGIAMVEYEFTGKNERKTLEEIANEVKVSRMTLHNWNHYDNNFIAYKNYLAAKFFDGHLAFVYKKMLDGINDGSMKGIELFLKRIGDLDTRSEVTINEGRGGSDEETPEERQKALLARLGEEENEEETSEDEDVDTE